MPVDASKSTAASASSGDLLRRGRPDLRVYFHPFRRPRPSELTRDPNERPATTLLCGRAAGMLRSAAALWRRRDLAAPGLLNIAGQPPTHFPREHFQARTPAYDCGALRGLRIGKVSEVTPGQARDERA